MTKRLTRRKADPVSHFRPHPWHGLEVGPAPPDILNAFIEITPFDLMKYEVDKVSGYLRVDRPAKGGARRHGRLRRQFRAVATRRLNVYVLVRIKTDRRHG